ncbi:MAG: hypothetical protein ACT4P4_14170 [Betaproteobacteria bacterium]
MNVVAWSLSARMLDARRASFSPDEYARRRIVLGLAAVYVLGCAFRSVLPMVDVPRLCLHETPLSRIFAGRSVATVSELAFAAQWALLMAEAGAVRAARAVVPLIVVAEILSWLAVLTTNDFFHAAENSTWTLTAALAAGFLATRRPLEGVAGRRVIAASLAIAAAYVLFMVTYVVPMYVLRWQQAVEYMSLAQGLREVLAPCRVERDWALWRADAAWLTPYFTLAVWMSIALALVPSLKARA